MADKPVRADEQLEGVLNGSAGVETLSPALLSALRFPVYKLACHVLEQPTHSAMAAEINAQPESIRELVRAECRRLTDLRNSRA